MSVASFGDSKDYGKFISRFMINVIHRKRINSLDVFLILVLMIARMQRNMNEELNLEATLPGWPGYAEDQG